MQLIGNVQLVAGNADSIPLIFELLAGEGIDPRGNPDVYLREYASFGVEEARELSLRAGSRAIAGLRRVFIVVSPGMTAEAQNALLKTLEEPAGDALFFLVVPAPRTLLPTLRSRAQTLDFGKGGTASIVDVAAFLQAAPAKRLDLIKPFLEKSDDEKRDLGAVLGFLAALERLLGESPRAHGEGLQALYRARRYAGDKGALLKPLLEQLALLA